VKWGICLTDAMGRKLWLAHTTDTESFWTPHREEAMPVDEMNMPTVILPFPNRAPILRAPIGV
jgi:hypothetical protein